MIELNCREVGAGSIISKEANEEENLFFGKEEATSFAQVSWYSSTRIHLGSNKSWNHRSAELLSPSIMTGLPVELYVQMISD